ncbi:Catalyzes late reaction in the cephamycin biosynthetic pathway protein [Rutstroemia sp. NJR-2017a BVV2]|nr:Catalyzes late reaction in the cephamycin biosynthetic pathway protein [Rutstroemia sp. NJR-2017a BVV2]
MSSHHHNVTTKLSYLDTTSPNWDSPIVVPKNPDDILKIESNNKKMIQTEVTIFDVGDRMSDYTLSEHAFQYVKLNTKLTDEDCLDDARIKEVYYPEVEKMIKEVTGASYVYVWNHNVRGPIAGGPNPVDPTKQPSMYVHSDQSDKGGRILVEDKIPDKKVTQDILQKRYASINIWRPRKTIYKDPFAITDANSVSDSDLVPIALKRWPDIVMEETLAVRPNPNHRWFYKYAQQPDEVLLFKNFDSRADGKTAKRVIHSAFVDESQEHMPPRQNIEVRCIAVWDD